MVLYELEDDVGSLMHVGYAGEKLRKERTNFLQTYLLFNCWILIVSFYDVLVFIHFVFNVAFINV